MIHSHQQRFRHDPDNGIFGDCFRTVIACLMQVEPEDVPHVCNGPDDPEDVGRADREMRDWLAERGYFIVGCAWNGSSPLDEVLAAGESWASGLYWMLSGQSRNGCNHVVICKGAAIVHDTSIDQSGIIGPMSNGLWSIETLVRPSPADFKRLPT